MAEQHLDRCMAIQKECFEPHHCEEKQAYLDRLKLYPEGMVVLMVPSPDPTVVSEEQDQSIETKWEVAGYVLFQPYFKGEIYKDGDTETLVEAIAAYRNPSDYTDRKPNCIYTHELSISTSFRGRGLTYPLTNYIEEFATQQNFNWLTLVALSTAHGFWMKTGYQTHSEIDYEGPCFYMEKRIPRFA